MEAPSSLLSIVFVFLLLVFGGCALVDSGTANEAPVAHAENVLTEAVAVPVLQDGRRL